MQQMERRGHQGPQRSALGNFKHSYDFVFATCNKLFVIVSDIYEALFICDTKIK